LIFHSLFVIMVLFFCKCIKYFRYNSNFLRTPKSFCASPEANDSPGDVREHLRPLCCVVGPRFPVCIFAGFEEGG
jgi:hypothetical protein